jgi:GTP1/Obg family GTP-binding protein
MFKVNVGKFSETGSYLQLVIAAGVQDKPAKNQAKIEENSNGKIEERLILLTKI